MMGASVLIVVLTVMSLRLFTRHGQSFIVPDLTGLNMDQLSALRNDYKFEFIIIDSVFDENQQPGTILRHDPAPNSTVKRGRKFYVTIVSSMPEMVVMPDLIDLSLRQATALLQSAGLQLGTVSYQPGSFQNAVLAQTYHGQSILVGEKIRRNSSINLLVSGSPQDGSQNESDGIATELSPVEESVEEAVKLTL
jgi:beta-lactam-binding protein with PASTA domain